MSDSFLVLHRCLPRRGRQESSLQLGDFNGVEGVDRGLRNTKDAEQFLKATQYTQLPEFLWRLIVCQSPPEHPIV